jgi:hypothetical protein
MEVLAPEFLLNAFVPVGKDILVRLGVLVKFSRLCRPVRLGPGGPSTADIQGAARFRDMLVLSCDLGIRREVDDVKVLKVWVAGVGRELRDATSAVGLSLLVVEDGQISRQRLHEALLPAKIALDVAQTNQRVSDPSIAFGVGQDPGSLVSSWDLASLHFVFTSSQHYLTNAAGLFHLALDGASGGTRSVELGDEVKVQLSFGQHVLIAGKMLPFDKKSRLT